MKDRVAELQGLLFKESYEHGHQHTPALALQVRLLAVGLNSVEKTILGRVTAWAETLLEEIRANR